MTAFDKWKIIERVIDVTAINVLCTYFDKKISENLHEKQNQNYSRKVSNIIHLVEQKRSYLDWCIVLLKNNTNDFIPLVRYHRHRFFCGNIILYLKLHMWPTSYNLHLSYYRSIEIQYRQLRWSGPIELIATARQRGDIEHC